MENSKIPSDELVSDIKDAINYLSGSLKYPELLAAVDELHSRLKKLAQPASAQPVAVPDGVVRATELAAAAIYFADSSDYLSALWDILRFLSPDIAALAESDTRAAWERAEQARAMLSAAKKPEGGE